MGMTFPGPLECYGIAEVGGCTYAHGILSVICPSVRNYVDLYQGTQITFKIHHTYGNSDSSMDCVTFQKLVTRALKSENSNLALFKRISRQSELRFEWFQVRRTFVHIFQTCVLNFKIESDSPVPV